MGKGKGCWGGGRDNRSPAPTDREPRLVDVTREHDLHDQVENLVLLARLAHLKNGDALLAIGGLERET